MLPALAQLAALQTLSLEGTAVPAAQQEAAIPLRRHAEERRARGAAALAALAAAQAAAAAAEPPPRYDAAAMRALRDSPFARCPPRSLPQLPLGQRAAQRATALAKSPGARGGGAGGGGARRPHSGDRRRGSTPR